MMPTSYFYFLHIISFLVLHTEEIFNIASYPPAISSCMV